MRAFTAPVLLMLLLIAGCPPAPQPSPQEPSETRATPSSSASAAPAASGSGTGGSERPGPTDAGVASSDAMRPDAAGSEGDPRIGIAAAERLLFLAEVPAEARDCHQRGGDDAIRCLLELRYAADPRAAKSALTLFEQAGTVAGLEEAHRMDGGWRGHIDLVPELPVGRHRRHLAWIASASGDFDDFFDGVAKHASRPLPYRHEPLKLRFFRSVGRTTPSAYASGWSIAYNVSGSLHRSANAVRETFFHEIFHLNDRAHGHWSAKILTPLYDQLVARCSSPAGKLNTRCLTPYAPNHTLVRGGTYYAFQPGNGVWEYAAELAIRYYREQRALLAGKALPQRPFKCGPDPNLRAWQLLVDEFFAGVDLSAACP